MPLKRLDYIRGYLNGANDLSASGQVEPITSLPLSTGLALGDYFDVTRAEAAQFSAPNGAFTLLEGRYMRVQLDPNAVIAGNGQLKPGQLLWWLPANANAYLVTNIEPTGAAFLAGVFLNTASNGALPVTPGNFFFMQAIWPGRATVQFRTTISNTTPAIGDSVFAAGAGAGVDASLVDDIGGTGTPPTLANIAGYIGKFIGVAETAPANAATRVIEIQKSALVMV